MSTAYDVDSDEYLQQKRLQQQASSNPIHTKPTYKPSPIPPPIPKITLGNIKVFESGIKATNWKFGKSQYEGEDFKFKTLETMIKDERGEERPAYTIGLYIINPNSKTRWTQYDKNALYRITHGEGWFMVGDDGKPLTTGYVLAVPQETRHCVLNQSANIECRIEVIFPGQIVVG